MCGMCFFFHSSLVLAHSYYYYNNEKKQFLSLNSLISSLYSSLPVS
jgi:hypothetical protein